eukprot:1714778-Pyramimonas_sp.AAC.1
MYASAGKRASYHKTLRHLNHLQPTLDRVLLPNTIPYTKTNVSIGASSLVRIALANNKPEASTQSEKNTEVKPTVMTVGESTPMLAWGRQRHTYYRARCITCKSDPLDYSLDH